MNDVVTQLSEAAAAAVERAAPSVLRVEGRRRGPSTGIAWAEDLVVAAHHTVERDEDVAIGLPDGRAATGTVVGRDPGTDLAVLRLADKGLVPPAWTALDGLKVGHFVLAVSRPGKTARAASGIVHALGDSWRTPAGGRVERYLEADIGPYPGFSGSLLVDLEGQALGLNTSGLLRGSGLTVPVATLRRVVGALVSHGHLRRGFLGIGTLSVRVPDPSRKGGLLITSVQPESPAARAGLLLGDVLVALDGQPVASASDLLPFLEEERIGAAVQAQVLRAGAYRDVPLSVGAREAAPGQA
jgi:S1-C subfamily serine protease